MDDRFYSHIYFGNGAGKTSAAIGLALRAAGHGKRVLVCQFLKEGTSGEVAKLLAAGVEVRCCGSGKFWFAMDDSERVALRERAKVFFDWIVATRENYDLIVLDEVCDAAALGLVSDGELRVFFTDGGCETVATGHAPDEDFVALFDYATEFVKRAHPYDKGVQAREGIEY